MTLVNHGVDALGIFLTGGATNTAASKSLGGVPSTVLNGRVRGSYGIVKKPIPTLRVDQVFPACGVGNGTIRGDGKGNYIFTAPGGTPGPSVSCPPGTSALLYDGTDVKNKAVRVYAEPGLKTKGLSTLELVSTLDGVFSHGSVTNAQRAAGVTTYRAVMLQGLGPTAVSKIRLWLPAVAGLQSTYSLGVEPAVAGAIQVIADEFTAPSGVSFSTPMTEGTALVVGSVSLASWVGLWIRRTFPPGGHVDPFESMQLAMKFLSN